MVRFTLLTDKIKNKNSDFVDISKMLCINSYPFTYYDVCYILKDTTNYSINKYSTQLVLHVCSKVSYNFHKLR